MPPPESFDINENSGINKLDNGVYYVLTPQSSKSFKSHVFNEGTPIYLPYLDSCSFSFQHNWNEADQALKQVAESILPGTGAVLSTGSSLSQIGGTLTGAGVHLSASSVYSDSSPISINVNTKLFSNKGDGSMLKFIDKIRAEGFGSLSWGTSNRLGAGGVLKHPGWWDIKIKSFSGGERTLFHCKDMVITTTSVEFFAPFVSGEGGGAEPMLANINIGFKSALRGFRESSSIGKNL